MTLPRRLLASTLGVMAALLSIQPLSAQDGVTPLAPVPAVGPATLALPPVLAELQQLAVRAECGDFTVQEVNAYIAEGNGRVAALKALMGTAGPAGDDEIEARTASIEHQISGAETFRDDVIQGMCRNEQAADATEPPAVEGPPAILITLPSEIVPTEISPTGVTPSTVSPTDIGAIPCVLRDQICTDLQGNPTGTGAAAGPFAGTWTGRYTGTFTSFGCQTTDSGDITVKVDQPTAGASVSGTVSYKGRAATKTCTTPRNITVGFDEACEARMGPIAPVGNSLKFQIICDGNPENLTVDLGIDGTARGTDTGQDASVSSSWSTTFNLRRN